MSATVDHLQALQAVKAEAARRAALRGEGAAAIWARIPERTRTVLVMLGTDKVGDPRKMARLRWSDLSDSDRNSIGATARALVRELAGVEAMR